MTVKRFTQRVGGPSSVTYVGSGKLEEIRQYIKDEEDAERPVGMVIFDDELSAKQIRNIEKELEVKILDRTSLILDIFAMRAQTAEAKTQVELAQYRYMLPRLQRLWTHLERQGGGSGSGGGKGSVGLRGPGETQLEMDRRIILGRMSLLKQRLAEIDRQKTTQRKNRGRMIRVALVGYTNVGKSTIMNLLSKSEVFAENKLFATLDTTVRKVVIDNLPFLLPDIDVDFENLTAAHEYVEKKYSADHVSRVITFGTMAAKSAIKDVARISRLSIEESTRLTKMVPDRLSEMKEKTYPFNPKLDELKPGFKAFEEEVEVPDPENFRTNH